MQKLFLTRVLKPLHSHYMLWWSRKVKQHEDIKTDQHFCIIFENISWWDKNVFECVYVNIFFLMAIDTFLVVIRFYYYIFAYGEKKCLYPFTINDYEIPMHIVGHCKCLEECTNYFFHAILYWVTLTVVVKRAAY